jgi:hypothetical protein
MILFAFPYAKPLGRKPHCPVPILLLVHPTLDDHFKLNTCAIAYMCTGHPGFCQVEYLLFARRFNFPFHLDKAEDFLLYLSRYETRPWTLSGARITARPDCTAFFRPGEGQCLYKNRNPAD